MIFNTIKFDDITVLIRLTAISNATVSFYAVVKVIPFFMKLRLEVLSLPMSLMIFDKILYI